jgi:hypothetical protein
VRGARGDPAGVNESTTGDLLTASSVVAALLTFLYVNAYATIAGALDIERGERHSADLQAERRQVKAAVRRALAVCLAALALAAIFTPEVTDLIRDGHVFGRYDPIALSLTVVWLTFALVAAHAGYSLRLLAQKHRQLAGD